MTIDELDAGSLDVATVDRGAWEDSIELVSIPGAELIDGVCEAKLLVLSRSEGGGPEDIELEIAIFEVNSELSLGREEALVPKEVVAGRV